MSSSSAVRFEASLRRGSIQTLLNRLCEHNMVVSRHSNAIGEVVWNIHWCLAHHPTINSPALPVKLILDSEDWITAPGVPESDQERYRMVHGFLNAVINPNSHSVFDEESEEEESSDSNEVSETESESESESESETESETDSNSFEGSHVDVCPAAVSNRMQVFVQPSPTSSFALLAFGAVTLFSSMLCLATLYTDRCTSRN